jgi:hypothetical protein
MWILDLNAEHRYISPADHRHICRTSVVLYGEVRLCNEVPVEPHNLRLESIGAWSSGDRDGVARHASTSEQE